MFDVCSYFAARNEGLTVPCHLSVARSSVHAMPLLRLLCGHRQMIEDDDERLNRWSDLKTVQQALRSVFRRRGISLMLTPYLPAHGEHLFPVVYIDPSPNRTERIRNELYLVREYDTATLIHRHTITITPKLTNKRPPCQTNLT